MILATETASGGGFSMIIILVAMIAIMYFLMIRPQSKERKRTEAMLASMEIGDAIVTTSGFYGVIIDMTDEDVIVEFGNNKNCRIPMKKGAIIQVEKANAAAAEPVVPAKGKKGKAVEDAAEAVKDTAEEVKETAEEAVENAAEEAKEAAAEAAEEAAEKIGE